MYYTTVRWWGILTIIAVGVILCVLIAYVSLAWAIGVGIFYAIVCTIGLWFSFVMMEGAMAQTGGVSSQPFFDIVDDRDPKVVDAYNRGILPRIPDEEEVDEAPAVESCPSCGAMLSRSNAKYCDECGKPIRSLPPVAPDSSGNQRPPDP